MTIADVIEEKIKEYKGKSFLKKDLTSYIKSFKLFNDVTVINQIKATTVNNPGRRFLGIGKDLLYQIDRYTLREATPKDLLAEDYVGGFTDDDLYNMARQMTSTEPCVRRKTYDDFVFLIGCTTSKNIKKKESTGFNFNNAHYSKKAKDVYVGLTYDYFKEASEAEKVPLIILSAKYGIITGDNLIEHYDLSLADCSRNQLKTIKKYTDNYDVTSNLINLLNKMEIYDTVLFMGLSQQYLTRISLDVLNNYLEEKNVYGVYFGNIARIDYSNLIEVRGKDLHKKYKGHMRKRGVITSLMKEKLKEYKKKDSNYDNHIKDYILEIIKNL